MERETVEAMVCRILDAAEFVHDGATVIQRYDIEENLCEAIQVRIEKVYQDGLADGVLTVAQ